MGLDTWKDVFDNYVDMAGVPEDRKKNLLRNFLNAVAQKAYCSMSTATN